MSDFDTRPPHSAHDDQVPVPPTASDALALPALTAPTWTPDGPAPLLPAGSPAPGLFTSAGVGDSPSPLSSAAEQKQRADEAALSTTGGRFSGDGPPSDSGYSWGKFGSDVWGGLKGAARGVVEPALEVMDFGQMGAAMIAQKWFPEQYHDVDFLSGAGKTLSKHPDQAFETGLVEATAMPTGGGSALVDNIYHVFHDKMDPDEAQSVLTQGAVSQVASAGLGVGLSKATGSGWTGRGPAANPEADQAMIDNLVRERAARNASSNATLGQGMHAATGKTTAVMESIPGEDGGPANPSDHAEPQIQGELGPFGGRTIAVDQVPCAANCTPMLKGQGMTGSVRVISPENPDSPGKSPRTAAVKAAAGKINARPRETMRVPFNPPIHPAAPQGDDDEQ